MSKYRITLEGKVYEMEIELQEEKQTKPVQKKELTKYTNAAKDATVLVIDPAAERKVCNDLGVVKAPMPGTVLRVEKKQGDTVKSGEVIIILEAMKMENEILAPKDGIIEKMNTAVGEAVSGNSILFTIR